MIKYPHPEQVQNQIAQMTYTQVQILERILAMLEKVDAKLDAILERGNDDD